MRDLRWVWVDEETDYAPHWRLVVFLDQPIEHPQYEKARKAIPIMICTCGPPGGKEA